MSHYTADCLPIAEWTWKSPANLRRLVLFVSATIQQRFETVATITADIEAHGADSRFLFGSKRDTFDAITPNADDLFYTLYKIQLIHGRDRLGTEKALEEIIRLPGLGIVKGAFVLQMLGFEAGCLDTHNLRRFGLSAETFKVSRKASDALRRRKISAYLDACENAGGSASLWNTWCDYVAAAWPRTWIDGKTVSAWHRKCLGLI